MYGLIVLGAMMLYVVLCIVFVKYIRRQFPEHRRLAGWAALLLFNLPLLYELLPASVAQSWHCHRDAGFWLYTTPEQWKERNPGVAETLERVKGQETKPLGEGRFRRIYHLNTRFDWVFDTREILHNLYRVEETVVDTATGEVMARHLSYFQRDLDWFGPAGMDRGCYRREERERWRIYGKMFREYMREFARMGGANEDE
jgi:hypothetical protein